MNYIKLPFQKIKLSFAGAIALVSLFASCIPVHAQSEKPADGEQQSQPSQPVTQRQKDEPERFVPPTPPDLGAPGQREGAASRGACPKIAQPLTALVPVTKSASGEQQQVKQLAMTSSESVWSLTVATHPTFWFYVPYAPPSLKSVEFALQDEQDEDIYRTTVDLPAVPGIVSLSLPANSKPLETGKPYHWFFKIYCNPQTTSVPIFVEGWVQRVTPTPSLANQLKTATPQKRIDLYAEAGLWHDALTALGELRQANPQNANLTANWNKLLHSVGLADIASKPIVKCCTPLKGLGVRGEERGENGTRGQLSTIRASKI